MTVRSGSPGTAETGEWRRFVAIFMRAGLGMLAVVYIFVLLVDPYGDVPFSLPFQRAIVSITQRHMYAQIVRSRRYDSLIVGTSTARLLDPDLLDRAFGVRFANLSMDSMTAWEQRAMIEFFRRNAGTPKALIIGLDVVWCTPVADSIRTTSFGYPKWLYDDNPWNDYLYLLNTGSAEIAGRMVGYWLGLQSPRIRFDGYGVFLPPESRYDPARARVTIWGSGGPRPLPDLDPPPLSPAQRQHLSFPALAWLDALLAELPSTRKVLAYMPIHVAGQPWPGTQDAADEAECKARIATIARNRGAKVIDWRISSSLTRNDDNYWDKLHYRVPVANRITEELGAAAVSNRESTDGSYHLVVR